MRAGSKGVLPETSAALEQLAEGRIKEALELINRQGPHRFTAIFAFESPLLRMACVFDRDQAEILTADDLMPLEESYCAFIWKSRHKFIVLDSQTDCRVEGHAKQPLFRSYCGVPILNPDGSLWGTICAYDTQPHPVSESLVALLEQAAGQLRLNLEADAVLSGLRDA